MRAASAEVRLHLRLYLILQKVIWSLAHVPPAESKPTELVTWDLLFSSQFLKRDFDILVVGASSDHNLSLLQPFLKGKVTTPVRNKDQTGTGTLFHIASLPPASFTWWFLMSCKQPSNTVDEPPRYWRCSPSVHPSAQLAKGKPT